MKSELSFAQVFGPQQIKSGFDGASTKSKCFFHVEFTSENYYEKASLLAVQEKTMTLIKFAIEANPNI